MPEGISLDLLQHLSSAWGDISERTFQRNPGRGNLTLCIGMSALHFFISGSKPFSEILKLPVEIGQAVFKPINKDEGDVWGNAFDAQPNQNWEAGLPYEEIQYSKPVVSGDTSPQHARRPQRGKLPDLRPVDRQPQPRRLLPELAQGSPEPTAGW